MLVPQPPSLAQRLLRRSLRRAMAIASALLLVVGTPGGTLARTALAEYEVLSEWNVQEQLAPHVAPHLSERSASRRTSATLPTACRATAPNTSQSGYSQHWHPQPLGDALRARNGFGGPLLT